MEARNRPIKAQLTARSELTLNTALLAAVLIALGVIARVVPHEANFAPIAAMAMFGAVYLKPRYALIVPLAALIISDIALGFDSLAGRLSVYGASVVVGLIGLAIRRHKTLATVVGGTIAGSVVFYLVTNLVWLYPPVMYPHDIAGQLVSYYNALPFFRATLMGDLFYVGLLFGSYEAASYLAKRTQARVASSTNSV